MSKTTRCILVALACGALMAASCDDQPPRPGRAAANGDLLGPLLDATGLVQCTPLAPDSVTQVIGPSGGTIQIGPHSLTVPANALDSDVAITAVIRADSVNVIWFAPEGLQFDGQATLVMSYANCGLLAGLLPKHIAYTSNALDILDLVPSLNLSLSQSVRGKIRHFSGYAVAW